MANVKINSTTNNVKVTSTNQKVTVTDNNIGTTVNVSPTDNGLITVSAPGPQGARGIDGINGGGVSSFTELNDVPFLYSSSLQTLTHITASGDISASGDITANKLYVDQYIYHTNNKITYLNFTKNRLRFNIGGISYIDMNDETGPPRDITFNDGGNNVDLTIKGSSNNPLFKTDASLNRIGTHGKGSPEAAFHIGGSELRVDGNISASGFISGSTIVGPTGSFEYISTNQYIAHKGDENTRINFTDNKIKFEAGGMSFLSLYDDDSAPFTATVNNDSNRINFKVMDKNNDLLLKTDSDAYNVLLHYAGNEKLSTQAGGINVTGHITASGDISASATVIADSFIGKTSQISFSGSAAVLGSVKMGSNWDQSLQQNQLALAHGNIVGASPSRAMELTAQSTGETWMLNDSSLLISIDKLNNSTDDYFLIGEGIWPGVTGKTFFKVHENGTYVNGSVTASGHVSSSGGNLIISQSITFGTQEIAEIIAPTELRIKGGASVDYMRLKEGNIDLFLNGAEVVSVEDAQIVFNASNQNIDFKIARDDGVNAFFVDAAANRNKLRGYTTVGLNTAPNADNSKLGPVALLVSGSQGTIGHISASGAVTASDLLIDGSQVNFTNLPTSDPGVAGRLWNDSNTVKISAG